MKRIWRNPFIWAFLLGIVFIHLQRTLAQARRKAPPPLVELSPWALQDQLGHPFGSKNLQGKVYIADFFFTKCPSICPMLTKSMKEVQKRFLGKEQLVQFVSFTVDPENDTPHVMQAYIRANEIDTSNWTFVTGSKIEMIQLITGNMKLHVGEQKPVSEAPNLYDISHRSELALFDQNGNLRGLFPTDPTGLAALVGATQILLE